MYSMVTSCHSCCEMWHAVADGHTVSTEPLKAPSARASPCLYWFDHEFACAEQHVCLQYMRSASPAQHVEFACCVLLSVHVVRLQGKLAAGQSNKPHVLSRRVGIVNIYSQHCNFSACLPRWPSSIASLPVIAHPAGHEKCNSL